METETRPLIADFAPGGEFAEHDPDGMDCGECVMPTTRCACGGVRHVNYLDEFRDADGEYWMTYEWCCSGCGSHDPPP